MYIIISKTDRYMQTDSWIAEHSIKLVNVEPMAFCQAVCYYHTTEYKKKLLQILQKSHIEHLKVLSLVFIVTLFHKVIAIVNY